MRGPHLGRLGSFPINSYCKEKVRPGTWEETLNIINDRLFKKSEGPLRL